jgi:hypothetical protein
MGGGEQSGPRDDVCFSSIHPSIQPTLEPFSAAGQTITSRAHGGIRTNQVHTRVRFAPALVGCAASDPLCVHSFRFAQTLRQYTFLPFHS